MKAVSNDGRQWQSLMRAVSHEGCLARRWSLMRAVSQGWSTMKAVSHEAVSNLVFLRPVNQCGYIRVKCFVSP